MTPFHDVFRQMPTSMDDPGDMKFRYFRLKASVLELFNPPLFTFLLQTLDRYVRDELKTPSVVSDKSAAVEESVKAFKKLGHVSLPRVDADKISHMKSYLESRPLYPGQYSRDDAPITREEARQGKYATYQLEDLVPCPHLMELANHPETLSIIERYLGTVPIILGYRAWWSFANEQLPTDAQRFHRDGDDFRFCKLFIYLTDVNEENGPHAYMEGTHDFEEIVRLRQSWQGGTTEFDDWYLRALRKTDSQVKRVFGADPVLMTGTVGTSFIVDTSGIHKGKLPEKGERLVCQVLYSVSPQPLELIDFLAVSGNVNSQVPAWLAEPPNRYVNQLFLSPVGGAA